MSGRTLETKLSRILHSYWTTHHTTTGVTPVELLMKRKLQTNLDRLRPSTSITTPPSNEQTGREAEAKIGVELRQQASDSEAVAIG